jgi:hypothetical protein
MRLRDTVREAAMTACAIVVMPVACAAAGLLFGVAATATMVFFVWREHGRDEECDDGSREG